jgi:hypothetical protein
MKIRPLGTELFYVERQTDERTEMTKLIIVFIFSAKGPDVQPVNAVQGNNRCLF